MDKIIEFYLDLSNMNKFQTRIFEHNFKEYIKHIKECIKKKEHTKEIKDINNSKIGFTLPKLYEISRVLVEDDYQFVFDYYNKHTGAFVRVYLEKQ